MSSDERRQSELNRPDLPDVTRLNRNVLLVAGMGVGVIILAVTHVVRSDARPAAADSSRPPVEAGAVASFLREPPQGTTPVPVPPPAYPELGQDLTGVAMEPVAGTGGISQPGAYASAPYDPYAVSYEAQAAPPRPDPRRQAYQRALQAGLRSRDARAEQGPEMDVPVSPAAYAMDGLSGSGVPTRALTSAAASRPSMAQPRNRHEEFLASVADGREASIYTAARVETPISEFQIMAGAVLPAMMVTEINSDLPGEILAQVSRNIYDSQQRHLLIPRGTKVIGRYDSQVALGQSRVLIAWTRLIFPDGRSLSLPGLPTKDMRGASGLRSRVDNHTGRLYGQAILLSILGAGAQLSQPQQGSVFAAPSVGQVAAGALGQELSQVSMETVRRNMDVRPTLQVKPGTRFYIFLERDLVLDGPYEG